MGYSLENMIQRGQAGALYVKIQRRQFSILFFIAHFLLLYGIQLICTYLSSLDSRVLHVKKPGKYGLNRVK